MRDPRKRPNVLLVIADDHRADAIGAMGSPVARTPAIDSLVRTGTAFSRARIMGGLMPAVCAPSRACLFTGCGAIRADADPGLAHGPHYEVQMPAGACTLPERFRAAGYETFLTGKWHNDIPSLLRSFEAGSAIFHGGMSSHTAVPVRDIDDFRKDAPTRIADGFSSEIFSGAADAFLRGRGRDRPFFACLAFTSPHDPRTPPPAYRALHDPSKIPLPTNFLPEHPFDNGALDIRDEKLAKKPLAPDVIREHLADYHGMISHHDACIGRLLATLRDTGQAETTIVVYLSDHGLAIGSHGLLGKQNLYEHSVRVPLILRGPGVPNGRRSDIPAYAFDLYATLCELAGVPAPKGLDSRSLVPAFGAGAPPSRDVLCSLYMNCQRSATDGRWKLIVTRAGGAERVQLFDLLNDPHEIRDLSADPASSGIAARLGRSLSEWQQRIGDRWWPAGTPSAVNAL